jgi:1,4-dihydroxy-2-naphthoate octaprenyltransferase
VLGIAFDTAAGILLPLLTLPWAARLIRTVLTRDDGPSLNGALVGCARLHAAFGALLALGLLS